MTVLTDWKGMVSGLSSDTKDAGLTPHFSSVSPPHFEGVKDMVEVML